MIQYQNTQFKIQLTPILIIQSTALTMSQIKKQVSSDLLLPKFSDDLNLDSKKQLYQKLANAKGSNLFTRYYQADEFIKRSDKDGLWLEKRELLSAALPTISIKSPQKKDHTGLNFASNNYLSFAKHPFTIEAGIEAAKEFGVNSAGSPLAFGATKYYGQLQKELGDFLESSCLLFSSGWLACFGFVKSLMKDYDSVLLDELSDKALFEGARYTTKNVFTFKHLDEEDLRLQLSNLRKTQKDGILVITDSLFSIDSCSPNIINYQKIASQNQAYLLLNIGHDFGVIGPRGRGVWEEQGLKQFNNVFYVGTGSKSLGVNFGFIALPSSKEYFIDFWKYFCSTYMFTNAINPIQSNCGLATVRMASSQLGKIHREQVLQNGAYLRESLLSKGHQVLGRVSPFVCVRVGNEGQARLIAKILMENNIFVNVLQYPAAKIGEATVRMSLTAEHTHEQIDKLVNAYDWSTKAAKNIMTKRQMKARL